MNRNPNNHPTCDTCTWWERYSPRTGHCHGGPPTATTNGKLWPRTKPDDWCGQHQPNTNQPTTNPTPA